MNPQDKNANITNEEKRNKIRRRYQNASTEGLEVIPAKQIVDFIEDAGVKRVAVYVRVSTDSAAQTSSYEIQQKYFSDMVAKYPSWILVETYADEGISGTSLNRRDEFNRMIEDCKKGKIDLIITKSVARWSRNILDGIGVIRELADRKPAIGVYFETENIYSLDPKKQTIISIHQTMAEEDSRSKSALQNISIDMRVSNGIMLTPPLLGYDKDEEAGLRINPDEAYTVRLIFYMYLSEYSSEEISEKLMVLGRKTKLGNTKWSSSTVLGILKNERHCGDVLARKTWTPNFLNGRSIKNRGEKTQYRKYDHHAAIVTRDDFLAVQKMLQNAKYGGNTFLPKLKVTSDGALRGFVTVHPHWGAFQPEDYRKASLSVREE